LTIKSTSHTFERIQKSEARSQKLPTLTPGLFL